MTVEDFVTAVRVSVKRLFLVNYPFPLRRAFSFPPPPLVVELEHVARRAWES